MATIRSLIELLQNEEGGLDQPVIFQYFTAEMADRSVEEFGEIADYLMDNNQFGQDTSDVFISWITEADDIMSNQCEDCGEQREDCECDDDEEEEE